MCVIGLLSNLYVGHCNLNFVGPSLEVRQSHTSRIVFIINFIQLILIFLQLHGQIRDIVLRFNDSGKLFFDRRSSCLVSRNKILETS